ncbi:MAG: AAA ATPase central domain protein [Candidatus Azambacteria bacterium GW2011_GWE1_42_9]|nr:MAG: AAA ATPase central domain protein [Candidatus Azambacteria bacterium GW2011_GWF1_41_10]KKS49530.1 MAG: AAA ATPase central domain protein [Candidatus Azambacteria bacterium GW2011_GWF2_42_22]KKS69569.1 MAG: AAA ATPase central domain protein [Candidatus Azambacteria bacterium GW2011_GWA2_42_62]KKS74025.1 MAG: AAA ATPase central domain protein [Candidatus Azambacteria bacterium GW2011_GWB1_42_72]KKS79507.1 MAG: AAA ATPase central domain protein [Candidatus Azambacteria bacterium GW2011_GWE
MMAENIFVVGKPPEWFCEMALKSRAGIAHLFILWGNIYDLQRNMRGEYLSLYQYLAEIFEQRGLIMFYSLSSGLQFASGEMEKMFRSRFLGADSSAPVSTGALSPTQVAAQGLQKNQAANAPLAQLIGETPDKTLKFLEKVLTDNGGGFKSVLIIDFAQNIAPNQIGNQNICDRISAEILERWAKDCRIKETGNTIVLISPSLAGLAEGLRSPCGEAVAIRITKPSESERISRWEYHQSSNSALFGRITNGLSLKQIDSIYCLAKEQKIPISLSIVKSKKREILETEFGDRIKIKVPKWGFDYFGGKPKLKEYMLEIRNNIINGIYRRAPMGILASGPPGTGKTFFFECWAHECGFNFVEIANPRSMWVGQSEEIAEKMFAALDDLSPVIVVEDEADQSETPRDTPNGDSGVSNRLRQMKFQFTSDPKRRGKVIWVRISNRSDLIDSAYKRDGRSDDTIPFLMPAPEEYESIFNVMFARYEIPTNITDFSPFAREVAGKIYCTGASVEWMVLEADKYSGREGKDKVETKHLNQAIADWEMKLDPREVDRQTILAIEGSSKRLRPDNWETILAETKKRLDGEQTSQSATGVSAIFPGLGHKIPISSDN